MSKAVNLAVISDLHVGATARTSDLNPYPGAGPSDGFLEHFKKHAKDLSLDVHALLVPGDVSNTAHPEEYLRATDAIKAIADALKVPAKRVFVVPGNHDMSWALVRAIENKDAPEKDSTRLGYRLRFEPLRRNQWLFERLGSTPSLSLLNDPYIAIDETDKLQVVRYNSAQDDLPDTKPHHGKIEQEHVQALDLLLAKHPAGEKYRVFITHHHPITYSDPIPLPDFSTLVNAENLMAVLVKHKFDMFIHGHKHIPRVQTYIADGHGMLIMCAGSFSQKLDDLFNKFHIVALEKRDATTSYAVGEVLSWCYRPGQWIESGRSFSDIGHRSPFGYHLSEVELTKACEAALKPTIDANSKLGWSDVELAIPNVKYLDTRLLDRVLQGCGAAWNCVVKFDPDHPAGLVMVKL